MAQQSDTSSTTPVCGCPNCSVECPARLPDSSGPVTCPGPDTVLLLGNLKVGKSTLFARLVGRHQHPFVPPNSDVELFRGPLAAGPLRHVVDVPGIYSLHDRSEESQLVRDFLFHRRVGGVLLVLDAKDIRRGLALALQLVEFELPMVVALNMADEARQRGVEVDAGALSRRVGVPVVPTVASEGTGIGSLKRALDSMHQSSLALCYPPMLSDAMSCFEGIKPAEPISSRGLTYLALVQTPEAQTQLRSVLPEPVVERLSGCLAEARQRTNREPDILLAETEQAQADALAGAVQRTTAPPRAGWLDRLSVWTRRPLTGFPIAAAVVAVCYLFVGTVGAQWLVGLLEGELFGEWLMPLISGWVGHLPWAWLRDLLVGDFGLISVGVVLGLGIVTPVLATFFIAFAVLEDSGYLPRLSLLLDRFLRLIGLNGKGVLPLFMGFSCVTMAVLTTRMLDRRKQRIIATLLLMSAFPCAPMFGVMMVLLGRMSGWATVTLVLVLVSQFLIVGAIANRVIPGKRHDFILEIPPLRLPRLSNILLKAGHRLLWFLREAVPYFIIGTLGLYFLDLLGLLDGLREAMRPLLVRILGLPTQSADVFLLTILRREAGTALLVQQAEGGLYDGVQALVTLVVMSLMVPCVNSVLVMYKEQGALVSTVIFAFVMVYALVVGALLFAACTTLGVTF